MGLNLSLAAFEASRPKAETGTRWLNAIKGARANRRVEQLATQVLRVAIYSAR